VRIWST